MSSDNRPTYSSRLDGVDRMIAAVHGRPTRASDYLGGNGARMFFDAADRIEELERRVDEARRSLDALLVMLDPSLPGMDSFHLRQVRGYIEESIKRLRTDRDSRGREPELIDRYEIRRRGELQAYSKVSPEDAWISFFSLYTPEGIRRELAHINEWLERGYRVFHASQDERGGPITYRPLDGDGSGLPKENR